MRSASRSAPEPRPAIPFGQLVTIRHSVLSWAMAGLARAVATPAPARLAPARKSRLFMGCPPRVRGRGLGWEGGATNANRHTLERHGVAATRDRLTILRDQRKGERPIHPQDRECGS